MLMSYMPNRCLVTNNMRSGEASASCRLTDRHGYAALHDILSDRILAW